MNVLAHPRTLARIDQFIMSPGHALGLNGPVGAGKGHIARHIGAEVLDVQLVNIVNHPYVHVLDAAAKAGIDEIRKLQSFLTLTVPGSRDIKRLVVIENIGALRHEAQNALLKTLEEPPQDSLIIVTYSGQNQVLLTIRSRLQSIQILPVELPHAEAYYKNSYAHEEIERALHMSGGQAGLLTAILQDSDDHPLVKAIQQARQLSGLTRYQRLAMVDKIVKDKNMAPDLLMDGLSRLFTAGYKSSLGGKTIPQLRPIVRRLKLLEQARRDLHDNVQPKLVFSRLFLEF